MVPFKVFNTSFFPGIQHFLSLWEQFWLEILLAKLSFLLWIAAFLVLAGVSKTKMGGSGGVEA